MADEATGLNRREFVVALGVATCGCVMLGSASTAEAASTQPAGLIDVGTLADYTAEGATDKFIVKHKLLVVRHGTQLFASTSVCPHKGCAVKPAGHSGLVCPCHRSDFDLEGKPIKGPAKKPLVRYGIALDEQGHLQVDMTRKFESDQWAEAGSFVLIPQA